jgi:hypothetical protein
VRLGWRRQGLRLGVLSKCCTGGEENTGQSDKHLHDHFPSTFSPISTSRRFNGGRIDLSFMSASKKGRLA